MLILLDIDGVMVPANSWQKPDLLEDGFLAFSLKAVAALQRIIDATGAGIMLTTSHKSNYPISRWKDIFALRGIATVEVNSLSSNSLLISRKEEILAWYADQGTPPEHFVILDDDKGLNNLPAHIKSHLVLTSSSVGLTDELAATAITILQKNSGHY
ncbi:HAD domain-containing protein [Mucilaginibacter pedocola]|uniref:FCP1 homology domain-containing protein n=1 Tax=Mucilaginibacter pedocola TaxID=1792845 RepID=A0A1S9PHK0_9SPHI|nr:HAD domain-containing protein [Mucilaginibacter pedocola]OOQ60048.1 hypothetical protein BC343_27355 [Mucilaginibacter pedocola]